MNKYQSMGHDEAHSKNEQGEKPIDMQNMMKNIYNEYKMDTILTAYANRLCRMLMNMDKEDFYK